MRNHFLRAAVGNAPAYVTDNLVFHIDAGDTNSYSGSGTTVNSLVGNISSSSYNSNISHSTSDDGYWSFSNSPSTGTGIEFNSVTSFMPLGSSDMTYEFWAKFTSIFSTAFALVRTLANGNEEYNLFLFTSSSSTKSLQTYKDGNGFNTSDNSVTTSPSVWRHFIITHDTSTGTAKVYINGSLDTTNTDTTNWGAYSNNSDDQYLVRIGAVNTNSFFNMKGDISIVRFYKGKVLTATEVTQNYNAEKARYGY